jgi:hypothetical protein
LGGVAPETLSALGYELSYPTPIIGQAPGTLKNHYAPRVPLYLVEYGYLREQREADEADEANDISDSAMSDLVNVRALSPAHFAFLGWRESRPEFGVSAVLSSRGDSAEAAARIFACLRDLSETNVRGRAVEGIIAELPPPEGLGRAIRDRLKRGASGYARVVNTKWHAPLND